MNFSFVKYLIRISFQIHCLTLPLARNRQIELVDKNILPLYYEYNVSVYMWK